MRGGRFREQGFTLIEVLIALTLLSIMVALLFSVLRVCAQSWEAGERKLAQVSEIASVNNFFRLYLATARPEWEDDSVMFRGRAKQVQFVSAFEASAGRSGLQQIKVHMQQDGEHTLQVSIKPFYAQLQDEQWQSAVLMEHVQEFKVFYRGQEVEEDWLTEWQEEKEMPALVKIKIRQEQQEDWLEQVVAIKSKSPTIKRGKK